MFIVSLLLNSKKKEISLILQSLSDQFQMMCLIFYELERSFFLLDLNLLIIFLCIMNNENVTIKIRTLISLRSRLQKKR